MQNFADRIEDMADNANNSREELLSIEAMEQKVEALRQQVSQAAQESSASSDISASLVPQTTLQQEPAIEIVDQITSMFKEGGMSAKMMADTFGDQLTGVIGEMMRNEIKFEKHQKKLEELAAIIEVSRQQNINMQNSATQQNITQLDSQRLASQLTSSFQAMSQIDTSLRQSLQSLQVDQSRIAEINRLQQNPNLLQQAQQLQTQTAQRINQATDLLIQNTNAARQVSEIMKLNNAGAENVIQLSQTAQQVVRQAIEQATIRADNPAVTNPAINNQAIKDSVARLELVNNDLQRMVQRGFEQPQIGNNMNLIAEKANSANAIELNRSAQQQIERAVVQQQTQQQQIERTNQVQQQQQAAQRNEAQRISQEIATKPVPVQQLRQEMVQKPEIKTEPVRVEPKQEKLPIRESEVKQREEVKKVEIREKEQEVKIKDIIQKEADKPKIKLAETETSKPENRPVNPVNKPDLKDLLRKSGSGLKPPTNPASPSGCGDCGGERGCPGCPKAGIITTASFRQNTATKSVGG